MTHAHWIYETDEAGNGHRCYYDGTDWHALVECPDGNCAASSAPFRTDAVTKARIKLGLPVMATIFPTPGEWSAHGPKCRGEPMPDPMQAVAMAIHERNAALRRFGDRVLPPWEWVLVAGVMAAVFVWPGLVAL